uniref:DUF4587 domain-containing protein n=1 Tax=Salarias fasciatus TaxID=181472 RepID=A0A672I122_SALFA
TLRMTVGNDDGQMHAIQRARRRKQHLLQKLRELHLLEDVNRPHTWGGSRRHHSHCITAPQFPPPPPPANQNFFITAASGPTDLPGTVLPGNTIRQHQRRYITKIRLSSACARSMLAFVCLCVFVLDMVELMLMQNAQMHQIIMHNMMLNAMPPMVLSPPGGLGPYQGNHFFGRAHDKPRANAVYHHHHFGPTPTAPHLPPINYSTYAPGSPLASGGPADGQASLFHHATAPVTLPPL